MLHNNLQTLHAAANQHLELALRKGHQRFDTISTLNHNRCKNFSMGESLPTLFLHMMNIYLMFLLFYFFFFFFFFCDTQLNLDLEKTKEKKSFGEYSLTLFHVGESLPTLFWKSGELMVNLDLTCRC